MKKKTLIAWAIMDKYNWERSIRYCYAGEKGSFNYRKGLVAIYFTKPTVSKKWKDKKLITKVKIEII